MLAQLAAYLEVQEKVRKEIEAVVQRRGRKESGEPDLPSYNDINSLHYLAAVITETQRLYPVANFFPREVLVFSLVPTTPHNTTPHHTSPHNSSPYDK